MLGLGTSLVKGGKVGRIYVKDGLKLYMPYRGSDSAETQFVGTGSTSFDGHTDYIATGTDIADDLGDGYAGALTITMWFKFTGASGGSDDGMFQMAPAGDWTTRPIMLRHHGNLIYFRTADSSAVSTAYTETNVWRHLTCMADRPKAELRIYLDGVLKNTDSMGQDLDLDGLTTYIGVYAAPQYAFTGKIKNVALWNRILTATEIQNVMYKSYAEVSGRLKDNLMSWKALDGEVGSDGNAGSGYILDEVSGAGSTTNLGTITNAVVNTDLYGGDTPVMPRAIDNAPTVQADAIGAGSASFNGSSDNISLGNDSSLQVGTSDFSVTAWVYRTADDGAIFGYGDTSPNPFFHIYENATEQLRVRINDGGGDTNMKSSASSFAEDEWTHVAVTIDRDSATGGKIYFDGIEATVDEDDFTSQQSTLVNGSVGAYIGARASGGSLSSFHAGNISQVGLWNRVLTQAEIQSIMEKTFEELTALEKTNLVSYWALDEADGNGVLDKVDETLGSELVTNGGFDSATTSWTPTRSTIASIAGGQSGNCLEITWASGSTQYAAQGLGTVATVGKVYKITWQVKSGTSGDEAYIIRVWDGSDYVVSDERTSSSSWVEGTAFWLAATTTITVELWKNSSTEATMLFDTISVKETNGNPGVLI